MPDPVESIQVFNLPTKQPSTDTHTCATDNPHIIPEDEEDDNVKTLRARFKPNRNTSILPRVSIEYAPTSELL